MNDDVNHRSVEPAISVVIPAFNRESVIARAVRSVLAQTFLPREIIVVDDGSTDDTAVRAGAFGDRVRLILQAQGGPARARNRGVREATGDWIAFLDSDDVWDAAYLRTVARVIRDTEGRADFYFSDAERFIGSGWTTHWQWCRFAIREVFELRDDARDWVMRDVQPMLIPFTVVRSSAFRRCGGFCENLWKGEDTHLFTVLGLGNSSCAIAGPGGRVMDDGRQENRLTGRFGPDSIRRWEDAITMNRDLLERFPSADRATRAVFEDRLLDGYWRLGRLHWSQGNYARSLAAAGRFLAASRRSFELLAAKLMAGRREKAGSAPGEKV
jgi:hypothetical protein